MECPRLKHYARLNWNGTVGRCGHMIGSENFDSFDEMESSRWLQSIKDKMSNDQWPEECLRCATTEKLNGSSIRLSAIDRHRILYAQNKEYLIVGGVLDNVCNSACISCNENLSTKIGSLKSKDYPRYNNYDKLQTFPLERIFEIDINGGEPSASKNYKKLLQNLPSNVKIIRINTNGSKFIEELPIILERGIRIIVTLSLDGVGDVHDYARWPIKWNNHQIIVQKYLELRKQYPKLCNIDAWTTVSCLNIGYLDSIYDYVTQLNIGHQYGLLVDPQPMSIEYSNSFTIQAKEKIKNSKYETIKNLLPKIASKEDNTSELKQFLSAQDKMRKINYQNYYKDLTL